jgi:outer membrane protein OmpA-like peptidoglycan-associated protein
MKSSKTAIGRAMAGTVIAFVCGVMLADAAVITPGVKAEVKGRISKRDVDTLTIQDAAGINTTILMTDTTAIKSSKKGLGVFRRGKNFEATSLLRGLMIDVDGVGNSEGQLVAKEIRFNEADLKEVMTVHSRVQPVEDEQKRQGAKLDETTEIAKNADAEAARANVNADAAHQRLDAVNDRITGLDDFVVKEGVSVYFPVNKYTLTDTDKKALDDLATKALALKGYVIEVAGFADSTGNADKNLELSQRRADAVVQYLALNHNIPPRRIVTPIGYGDTKSQGGNAEAQKLDRRVDAKILVNKGQSQ